MAPSDGVDLFTLPPYALPAAEKEQALLPRLRELTAFHYAQCEPYRRIVDGVFGGLGTYDRPEDLPFLPVSLFKTLELRSVPMASVVKVLSSSGTTGRQPSRIFLDSQTAQLQSRILVRIMQHFLGKERRPMIVLDHAGVVKDRRSFSARGAGILGMLQFGRKPFYALDEHMTLDIAGVNRYLEEFAGQPVLLFGFTFMAWQYFVRALETSGERLSIPGGVLLHTGGWKKLQSLAVTPTEFNARVEAVSAIPRTLNYYGMVEHIGSVYFENPLRYLQTPVYSDIIVRDPVSLRPLPDGQPGQVQLLGSLAQSYPGHSILTEDLGVIRGSDDPSTGMGGRYFEILGRIPQSEARGCSDTFQAPSGGPNG